MTTGPVPICEACARLEPIERDGDYLLGCAAFPAGIPDDIYEGGFDHRQPHTGDHGVRFELAAGEEAALAAFEQNVAIERGSRN